jgi:hypothetical protein
MNKNREKTAVRLSLLFAYAGIFGAGIWRAFRRKPDAAHEPQVPPEEPLEDLSHDTPGDAPLDRLARRATLEENIPVLFRPGGGVADPKTPLPEGPSHPWTHTSRNVADLLEHQSLESAPLTGWSMPMPERLPVPTYAPAVMALGIVIFAMGLATTWYVCLIGSVVFAIAAWRWAGELQGE